MLDCLDLGECIQVKQKSSAKSLIITFWISEATMVGFRLTCAESDDATTGHEELTRTGPRTEYKFVSVNGSPNSWDDLKWIWPSSKTPKGSTNEID
jgi:hypothetical protein